jgi:hypothetical protein
MAICSLLRLVASRRSPRSSWCRTFDPKAAGSNPARPTFALEFLSGTGSSLAPVRTMFAAYWLVIVTGIVVYLVVGVAHN